MEAMPNFKYQNLLLLWTFKHGLHIQDVYVTHHALISRHQQPQGQGHMAGGGDVIWKCLMQGTQIPNTNTVTHIDLKL